MALAAAVVVLKMAVLTFPLLLLRAIYPRYRIDQALKIGWGKLLALSIAAVALSIVLKAAGVV